MTSGYFNAGFHTVTWKGISDKGLEVPAGVYIYTIETDSYRDIKKMILMEKCYILNLMLKVIFIQGLKNQYK